MSLQAAKILPSAALEHVAGQVTTTKTQPLTNIKDPKNPISSVPMVVPAPTDRNAVAKGLYKGGMKLAEVGQFSQAAEHFQQAVRLDPEYADAYAALGRAYFKMREWQMATENLRRAAKLNKKHREAHANAAGVKTLRQESETTRQPEQRKGTSTPAKEKEEPVGVRVAMSVTPASTPAEAKSVSPFSTEPTNEEVSLTKIYRVGPSDVLDIRLNDSQSPQSTLFTVTPSGLLEYPMLTEPLLVTGLTVEEVGTKIGNDLKQGALMDDPKVVVGVRDYASHTILVGGLVKDSGTKCLRREAIPLYVVVADAQPLPEAGKVTIVRNELNEIYDIDLTQVADMNLLVRPGDIVTLHPNVAQFFYIGGEVKFPGEKTYRRSLTLTQAIITAGGVTAKSKVAEIGRDDGRGFLVGTRFNLKGIQSGKAVDPLLKPGDRIMILR
jgi:protein involved in polysaccharide export with SLBB domain